MKEPLKKKDLVPRMKGQGYRDEDLSQRRSWVAEQTGVSFKHISASTLSGESMRGNIENPIGTVQMPVGIAGPLQIHGEHAQGTFYVPLATTEGALVRSYERGMVTITRSGGASVRIHMDENRISPVFFFDDVPQAFDFSQAVPGYLEQLQAEADATTNHGKLLKVECHPVGREVQVNFRYHTGDAQGMNMIVKATEKACRWLMANSRARRYYIFSGLNSEKRASGFLLGGGKGKKATAGVLIPKNLARMYLHASTKQIYDLWHHTVLGHLQANAIGYNGHYANGLTAMFIACGQDVANVANAAVGITNFELTEDEDLYASVTLPSLTVATVGGGTGLGTSRECLEMLGCSGGGHAAKFAEITAATLLAGELSMASAIASSEFVDAHESYGRNRPDEAANGNSDGNR